MTLLAQATNLVTFFVAIETLSIPLYILCAANLRREKSLESGLKYLIVGSLGSATLLYGMAFLYGASGSTDFAGIAHGVAKTGYILGGLVVASEAGVNAIVFYLAAYAFMNLAAFAVVVARERETVYGDHIDGVRGLGSDRPHLAWPLTISMLGLA